MRKHEHAPKRKSPANILFSKTRQGVLKAMFLQADRWWYLSELAQLLGVRPSTLQAELPELESGEILISRKDGNRIYYKANSNSPLFHEIKQILIKTIGLRDVIKDLLRPHDEKITTAFIFGSIPRGEEISTSDVDLMIIGDVRLSDLTRGLKKTELQIGRPINPTIYSRDDLLKQVQKRSNFIANVLRDKKLFVLGSESDLEELTK